MKRWPRRLMKADVAYLAFDKVPQNRLVRRLDHMGSHECQPIGYNIVLSGRKQSVVTEDWFPDWRPVTSGVPQGLVPGTQACSRALVKIGGMQQYEVVSL